MHGLKLVIKEDVMPQDQEQMPHFPALEKLAANGFLGRNLEQQAGNAQL